MSSLASLQNRLQPHLNKLESQLSGKPQQQPGASDSAYGYSNSHHPHPYSSPPTQPPSYPPHPQQQYYNHAAAPPPQQQQQQQQHYNHPPAPTRLHPQHQQPQQHHYAHPPAPAPPMAQPPMITGTLELVPFGSNMVVQNQRGETLITMSSASSTMSFTRGAHGGAGSEIASAKFHTWTTSKADLKWSVDGLNTSTQIKKEFDSVSALGHDTKWEKDGRKGALQLVAGKSGGLLGLGSHGDVIARFAVAEDKAARKKGAGRFELVRPGLGLRQVEEVVITCLVERERMRRAGEAVEGVSAGAEIIGALAGGG